MDLSDQTRHANFILHTFPPQQNMEPMTLQINGKKGRRVVCVLYSDGLRYSVFDLDSVSDGENEAEGEVGEQYQSADEDQIMAD
jgi:anaphase-promoting complex subunit 4